MVPLKKWRNLFFEKKKKKWPGWASKRGIFQQYLVCLATLYLGIRSLDFSNFWHAGSLIWSLKSNGDGFPQKIICPGSARKSLKKSKKKIEKNFFPKFFQIFFFNFFFKKTNFSHPKIFFSVPKSLTPPKKKIFLQSLINKMQ